MSDMNIKSVIEDAWIEFERGGEISNSADNLLSVVNELKGKLEEIWSIVETERACSAGHWDEEFGAGEVFDEIQSLAKVD